MYAEFDTVSFTAMSKIGSEPVLCDSLSRPPLSESPACGREPPAPDEKEDTQREAEDDGGGGRGGGGSRAAVAEEDGTQDEVSSNQAAEEGRGGEQGGDIRHGHDDDDDDDDEGYHTPTSPRHRIPADLPCPPAPRKALPEPRWRKRKAADREFYRVVWRRSQLPPLGFELVLCPVPLGSRTTESAASLADMLVKNKKNL